MGPEAARAPGAQVSAPCRDLLARLLVADPGERMTMAEIKVHSWFLEDLPDGALAMNDWYLQSRPVHDQARRPRPRPAPARPVRARRPAAPPTARLCMRNSCVSRMATTCQRGRGLRRWPGHAEGRRGAARSTRAWSRRWWRRRSCPACRASRCSLLSCEAARPAALRLRRRRRAGAAGSRVAQHCSTLLLGLLVRCVSCSGDEVLPLG